MRRHVFVAMFILPALMAASPGPSAGSENGLAATRGLVERLVASGRGETDVTLTRPDPLGGPSRVERGKLVVEPPARLRLDFPQTGERLAVRGSGGEWVQPGPKQMIRLNADQCEQVAGLWSVFLHGGDFNERRAGERRYLITPRDLDSGLPDSITIKLDAHGLPVALETRTGDEPATRYDFKAWRFTRPAGDAGFVLKAPKGFAVVDLP